MHTNNICVLLGVFSFFHIWSNFQQSYIFSGALGQKPCLWEFRVLDLITQSIYTNWYTIYQTPYQSEKRMIAKLDKISSTWPHEEEQIIVFSKPQVRVHVWGTEINLIQDKELEQAKGLSRSVCGLTFSPQLMLLKLILRCPNGLKGQASFVDDCSCLSVMSWWGGIPTRLCCSWTPR